MVNPLTHVTKDYNTSHVQKYRINTSNIFPNELCVVFGIAINRTAKNTNH